MTRVERYGDERNALVDRLTDAGIITRPELAHAFRIVPRHAFLAGRSVATAYADRAVVIKYDDAGRPISSASQPSMMAEMLEQLSVQPGDRVLEIGTGSGYNAALLAELVGGTGSVVTVEIEQDLATDARRALDAAGYERVTVVVGDGAEGYAPGAPYDAIIVTAGVPDVPEAWTAQLAEGGRLVVPLVHSSGIGSTVRFVKEDGQLLRGSERPCAFLALRRP